MSLTDKQCAEIAAWSRNLAASGPPPRVIVSRWHRPGEPDRTPTALYVHPEDYLALQRWADRQTAFHFPVVTTKATT
jgi:hypothetical protein